MSPWPALSVAAEGAPTPDAHGVLRFPRLLPGAYRLRCQPTQGVPPREAEGRQTVPDKQASSVPRCDPPLDTIDLLCPRNATRNAHRNAQECAAGCPTALCFRSGTIGLHDLAADEGTSNWGGVRPGCWINVIPAAGLILAPEGSSGCTCSYPLQASMALAPVERNENWSVFHTAGAALPVKHIAVNLGAPGDRRDAAGTLWLSFPRPPAKYGLRFGMRNELLPGCGYFHHNSDALGIDGTEAPWVFASGARGLTRSTLKLMDRGKTPAVYTVRLSFVELTHERAGKRMFDIKLQGNRVAENVDLFQAAGGMRRAHVKEFRSVRVADHLVIELVPTAAQPTPDRAPVLCGVEVEREDE